MIMIIVIILSIYGDADVVFSCFMGKALKGGEE
jgi:hypothetical protein